MIRPLLSFILVMIVSCQPRSQSAEAPLPSGDVTVFTNVNVVTMEDESILQRQQVIIENQRIFSISPEAPYPNGAKIIDGSGKYLVPGLAEMHAHIPTPQHGEELIEETMFLYLAGGVTTIRGMLGHPRHLELRQQVETGDILGPVIYTSGPSINGNTAPDTETVSKMVREQKAAGYDFLKLHPGISGMYSMF